MRLTAALCSEDSDVLDSAVEGVPVVTDSRHRHAAKRANSLRIERIRLSFLTIAGCISKRRVLSARIVVIRNPSPPATPARTTSRLQRMPILCVLDATVAAMGFAEGGDLHSQMLQFCIDYSRGLVEPRSSLDSNLDQQITTVFWLRWSDTGGVQ